MGQRLILPDTNILIYSASFLKPYHLYFQTWIERGNLVLSTIVVAEYLVRATPEEKEALDRLIDKYPVYDVDLQTARLAADIRRNQLKRKIKLHLPDCLIAAQAKLNHATLATLNPEDFPNEITTFKFV